MTDTMLICPLCPWTQEAKAPRARTPENVAAAPRVASALGLPASALLATHEHAARRRDERTLRRHLSTHGPDEWLPALTAAQRATYHLHLVTSTAEERTKVVDQAALIAQMGGVGDDELVALLHLAATRMMTPGVTERFRAVGIEPDPCRVAERIEEARRDPSAQEIIAELATPALTLEHLKAVAAACEQLGRREPATCHECHRDRTPQDHDYDPSQPVAGTPVGWYSGDDGEICGACMTRMIGGGGS